MRYRWTVSSDTTEAWIIKTCVEYGGLVENRIDLTLPPYTGTFAYDPDCVYELHAKNMCGEVIRRCVPKCGDCYPIAYVSVEGIPEYSPNWPAISSGIFTDLDTVPSYPVAFPDECYFTHVLWIEGGGFSVYGMQLDGYFIDTGMGGNWLVSVVINYGVGIRITDDYKFNTSYGLVYELEVSNPPCTSGEYVIPFARLRTHNDPSPPWSGPPWSPEDIVVKAYF